MNDINDTVETRTKVQIPFGSINKTLAAEDFSEICRMELNYKSLGSGYPLIILHGLFGSLDNWISLARMFGEEYTTYIVDLRNHGKSPRADTHSYPEMAADLIEFMDQQHISKAYLLGHSMGGKVVMEAALAHPERVSGLIIADMAPVQYNPHHAQIFKALQAIDPAKISNRNEAEQIMLPFIPEAGVRQFLLKNIDRNPEGSYAWKMNLPVLIRDYDKILEEISPGRKYSGPSLSIRGEKSGYVQDHQLPDFRELFPELEIETIPNAGHWVHAEAPAEFYKIVVNFLKRIRA